MVKEDNRGLRRRKKEQTKKEILQAGQALFIAHGFDKVSVDNIAEEAFVSRPTIYNYFAGGKDEIYFQLGINAFLSSYDVLTQALTEEMTGFQQFQYMCEMTFVASQRMPLLFRIISEFYHRLNTKNLPFEINHDEIAQNAYSPEYESYRGRYDEAYLLDFYVEMQRSAFLWKSTIDKGLKDGSIKRQDSPEHILHFVHLTITGMIEQSLLRRATLDRISLEFGKVKAQGLEILTDYVLTA